MKDYIIIKEDIATLKSDIKYIKAVVDRMDSPNTVNREKIETNRKFIYFIFAGLLGIVTYLTGIKFI